MEFLEMKNIVSEMKNILGLLGLAEEKISIRRYSNKYYPKGKQKQKN